MDTRSVTLADSPVKFNGWCLQEQLCKDNRQFELVAVLK